MKDLRDNALPITAIAAVIGFSMWLAWTGREWKGALDRNTEAIQILGDQFKDTWTRRDHDQWVMLLHEMNPSLKLPPPLTGTKETR